MKVYGQLERAQVENVGALPTAGVKGRVVFLTTDSRYYYDDGSNFVLIVGSNTTDTLTNKALVDSSTTIVDDSDNTKKLAFQVSGVTSGQTRTMTVPNYSGTMIASPSPLTTKGDILSHDGTTPVRQAIGSDNQVLIADSSVTNGLKWTTLQQGAKNYITYNNFENNAITGWTEMSATVGVIPTGTPTFSASAAASITIAATNTNPLAGSYSLQMVGTIAQGQGFATDVLTIDREDQAKVMQGSFYYEVASGASNANWSGTSSNTLSVYIYDVTNSTWIQPQGVYNLTQSSGQGFCSFTFQTASSVSQLRVVVWCANTASGSITVNFDDFYLGPQKVVYGAPVTDWVSYTPTWSSGGSAPAIGNGTIAGRSRRVGDSEQYEIEIVSGTTTTWGNNANAWTFSLQSGRAIDTAKVTNIATVFGTAQANVSGSGNVYDGVVIYQSGVTSTNQVMVLVTGGTAFAGWDSDSPAAWSASTANQRVALQFTVPISGWSSSVQMSNDTDTRVVTAQLSKATSQSINLASATKILFDSAVKDTHSGFSLANNHYVVPVSGTYRISGNVTFTASTGSGAVQAQLLIDGSVSKYAVNGKPGTASTESSVSFVFLEQLRSGQTIGLNIYQNIASPLSMLADATATGYTVMNIERLSGPSAIAASETVAALYTGAPPTGTLNGAGFNTTTYATKVTDSHGAYSSGSYTIPVSGRYNIAAANAQAATYAAGNNAVVAIFIDGNRSYDATQVGFTSAATLFPMVSVNGIPLNAGQVVTIRSLNQGTTPTFGSTVSQNYFSITRAGN